MSARWLLRILLAIAVAFLIFGFIEGMASVPSAEVAHCLWGHYDPAGCR